MQATERIFHGTEKEFDRFDKRATGASSVGEAMSRDAHFFTNSPAHASGFSGGVEGSRVWFGEVVYESAWEFEAEGLAYKDTTRIAVEAVANNWSKAQLREALLYTFHRRVLEIVSGEAIANCGMWIGMRRRQREWSPGRKPGRRIVARPGRKVRGCGISLDTINRLKRVYRAMAASYKGDHDLIVIRNSADNPILCPADLVDAIGRETHDVFVVVGEVRRKR